MVSDGRPDNDLLSRGSCSESRGGLFRFRFAQSEHSFVFGERCSGAALRLTTVWGALSDHVAIYAALGLSTPYGQAAPRSPLAAAAEGSNDDSQVPGGGGSAADRPSRRHESPQGAGQQQQSGRTNAKIVTIANKVVEGAARFRAVTAHCLEDPWASSLAADDELIPWSDVPKECGFRLEKPGTGEDQRRVTSAGKKEQQVKYTRFRQWAQMCGLSSEEITTILCAVGQTLDSISYLNILGSTLFVIDGLGRSHPSSTWSTGSPFFMVYIPTLTKGLTRGHHTGIFPALYVPTLGSMSFFIRFVTC